MRPLRLVSPAQRAICSMVTRKLSVVFLARTNSFSFGSSLIPASLSVCSNVALLIIRNLLAWFLMSLLGGSAGEVKTRRFSAETRNAKSRPRILKWVSLSVGRPSIARAGRSLPGMVPKSSPTQSRGSAARFRLYQRLDRVGGNLLVSQVPQLQCGRLPATTAGIGRARRSHTRHHSHYILK